MQKKEHTAHSTHKYSPDREQHYLGFAVGHIAPAAARECIVTMLEKPVISGQNSPDGTELNSRRYHGLPLRRQCKQRGFEFMRNLEVLRASVLRPIIQNLQAQGANVEPLLARAKLPLGIAERTEGLIPWFSAVRFPEIAAHHTGDPLFCAHSVLNSLERRSNHVLSIPLSPEGSALEGICTFVQNANAATTGSTVKLANSGDWIWILRQPYNSSLTESWHNEQLVIAGIVTAVASHLGQDWQPRKIQIRQATLPEVIPDSWSETEIEVSNPHTAVGLKLVDIVKYTNAVAKISAPPRTSRRAGLIKSVENDPQTLRSAVQAYIDPKATNVSHVAEAFGLKERTFRRRLTDAGVSFAELVEETRYRRSLDLLRNTDVSITELALELGYGYVENFTRAFRRRVGISPRKYRRMIADGTQRDP